MTGHYDRFLYFQGKEFFSMKIWMMTGCSSGLGKQLMPVALDITSPQMIEAVVQRIGTHFNTVSDRHIAMFKW